MSEENDLSGFLNGKTEYTIELFRFFIDEFSRLSDVNIRPLKSMISIEGKHNYVYITQLGKNFIHVVFHFNKPFEDNLCFSKIAQVPGTHQYNHHLRIYYKDDVNEEVKSFMKMAISGINND
ncbi:DUF5655 domain-containing protein [Pedobacter rhodius]|uniref:DUF5655 domain-containing protein n=1 Tax=Pedobacter rhodius TaxID=3004098 RepID=A0ABT4KW01_9SPHI|nr:DUF5655 domain-containing protein [Pedobacter sp. SJ11]MCZ4223095.1 DUF5655 domain-containing protein [Pedobacter sp. SJ11]